MSLMPSLVKMFHQYGQLLIVATLTITPLSLYASEDSDALLQEFQALAENPLSAEAGAALWVKDFDGRSCTSCHTDSLFTRGRHERTGKIIEPMAASANPDRYTKRKKMNKWFLRNCKWTIGRECTAQEKGDVLLWLTQQ